MPGCAARLARTRIMAAPLIAETISMSAPESHAVTALLRAWSRGEGNALEELLPLVYGELHRQAERYMRAQAVGHTLQTTDVVHEAYLRLVERQAGTNDWQGRDHFMAVASKAMRSVLVDYARARQAAKRGGPERVLTMGAAGDVAGREPEFDVMALDDALKRLAELDPRQAQVVEMRYFGGLGIDDAARILGVSHATVERDWRTARLWLRRELSAG